MRNVWMLLLTLTISTLFIHVPHIGQIGFLTHPTMIDPCTGEIIEIKLSYNQYVWWICQQLQIAVLAVCIWDESRTSRVRSPEQKAVVTRIYSAYLWIVIADIVIHVISYSDPLRHYRITWNILKTVIFIGVIVYEWLLRRRR